MDAILFTAPLGDFDNPVAGQLEMSSLEEALRLWEALCSSPYFRRMTLFLVSSFLL